MYMKRKAEFRMLGEIMGVVMILPVFRGLCLRKAEEQGSLRRQKT